MANLLEGKVIAVTGAASGIGAATADLLTSSGAVVAALDLNWPEAEPKSAEASDFFRSVYVASDGDVEMVFDEIVRHFGKLDGLATCAGINNIDSFDRLDAAMFRKMHEVNVIGTFNCLKSAASRMSRGGRMVTVSSIAGIMKSARAGRSGRTSMAWTLARLAKRSNAHQPAASASQAM